MTAAQPAPEPPKRGRGRPRVGVRVPVLIPADLLADIDREAAARGTTRAAEIRRRCQPRRTRTRKVTP